MRVRIRVMNYLLMVVLFLHSGMAICAGLDWKILPEGNTVTFSAAGKPGFIRINGEGAVATGKITENEGKVYGQVEVPLSTLKTGLELRDKHLKEKYLNVDKFPKAVFVLDPVLPNGTGFPFTGKLTIKEDTIPVSGSAKVNTIRLDTQEVTAEFKIEMKDLKSLGVPEYAGIKVADTVTVNLKFVASSK
jgi:polyisoprenoid-binding protein YceI